VDIPLAFGPPWSYTELALKPDASFSGREPTFLLAGKDLEPGQQ